MRKTICCTLSFFVFVITLPLMAQNKAPIPSKDPNSTKGETIGNASRAKAPKGTVTFKLDGKPMSANENTVQTMFVGMGMKDMAQGMISGRGSQFSISAVFMSAPKEGVVPSKNFMGSANIGFAFIFNGEQYDNSTNGNIEVKITKITQDGKNYYIAGTFSGKLHSIKDKSKSITITDGQFQSGHL